MLILFFKLLCGHAIADYALQSDYIACNKNRNFTPKGYDPERHGPIQTIWPYVLTAHAMIHGAMVGLITGNWYLAVAETVAHWFIDFGKCDKLYGIHTDQALHIFFKLAWCVA